MEARRKCDRRDSAILIEAISILVVDLIEHPCRRFAGSTTHERFVGMDRFEPDIDDWLKRKREPEIERTASDAVVTFSTNRRRDMLDGQGTILHTLSFGMTAVSI